MLRAIEFKDKRFRTKEDYNLLSPLTENTIILCHDYKLMDSLAEEILNAVNGKAQNIIVMVVMMKMLEKQRCG